MPKAFIISIIVFIIAGVTPQTADCQQTLTIPRIPLGLNEVDDRDEIASTLEILFFLTIITLAPAIVLLMTSFTRMVIVLSFVRQALGLQQIPANQVIIGLSLFLTLFLMKPVGTKIYEEALRPYLNEGISGREALPIAVDAMREFMFNNTRKKDLSLFHALASDGQPAMDKSDVGTLTLIPAFVISELNTAFLMAFLIYVPFLIIDLVISSVLMSMGMLLLPPVLISLPFKILLFVSVDGWNLIVTSLLKSFQVPL